LVSSEGWSIEKEDSLMNEPDFKVTLETDKSTGELLAVYFQIRRGKATTVKEVVDGAAFANYDRKGRLLGVELLAPCKITVLNQLAAREPEQYRGKIKRFINDSMPKKMVVAA
jgi:hypothetical protein